MVNDRGSAEVVLWHMGNGEGIPPIEEKIKGWITDRNTDHIDFEKRRRERSRRKLKPGEFNGSFFSSLNPEEQTKLLEAEATLMANRAMMGALHEAFVGGGVKLSSAILYSSNIVGWLGNLDERDDKYILFTLYNSHFSDPGQPSFEMTMTAALMEFVDMRRSLKELKRVGFVESAKQELVLGDNLNMAVSEGNKLRAELLSRIQIESGLSKKEWRRRHMGEKPETRLKLWNRLKEEDPVAYIALAAGHVFLAKLEEYRTINESDPVTRFVVQHVHENASGEEKRKINMVVSAMYEQTVGVVDEQIHNFERHSSRVLGVYRRDFRGEGE